MTATTGAASASAESWRRNKSCRIDDVDVIRDKPPITTLLCDVHSVVKATGTLHLVVLCTTIQGYYCRLVGKAQPHPFTPDWRVDPFASFILVATSETIPVARPELDRCPTESSSISLFSGCTLLYKEEGKKREEIAVSRPLKINEQHHWVDIK